LVAESIARRGARLPGNETNAQVRSWGSAGATVEITPDGLELFDAPHLAAEPLADEADSDGLLAQFTCHEQD
jgi:hypothetical protein